MFFIYFFLMKMYVYNLFLFLNVLLKQFNFCRYTIITLSLKTYVLFCFKISLHKNLLLKKFILSPDALCYIKMINILQNSLKKVILKFFLNLTQRVLPILLSINKKLFWHVKLNLKSCKIKNEFEFLRVILVLRYNECFYQNVFVYYYYYQINIFSYNIHTFKTFNLHTFKNVFHEKRVCYLKKLQRICFNYSKDKLPQRKACHVSVHFKLKPYIYCINLFFNIVLKQFSFRLQYNYVTFQN